MKIELDLTNREFTFLIFALRDYAYESDFNKLLAEAIRIKLTKNLLTHVQNQQEGVKLEQEGM